MYKHQAFVHMDSESSGAVSRHRDRDQLLGVNLLSGDHQPNVVDSQRWTVYSASQNLSAVLNDPNGGKQRDFFTKVWGDNFVEKTYVTCSPHLPEIRLQHFDVYIKKIARIYREHQQLNANSSKPSSHNELFQHDSNFRASGGLDKTHFDLSNLPMIFLQQTLNFSNPDTFNAIFCVPVENYFKEAGAGDYCTSCLPAKLVQENLSHYLDEVEVQIAQQVAHKSDAFFHAMTSHDALSEQLMQTVKIVKVLRDKIQLIDKSLVTDSLKILRLERLRYNRELVANKLKLMATVHQTQLTIQLLLSTSDYVTSLELISRTQEILLQELAGIHSFRHFGSQLLEMEKLIDKMLTTEFERYATSDLNRPLTEDQQVLAMDKLVSIIFGMLRQKHFHFIDTYKEEAFTTVKAVVKKMVIEVMAASDSGDVELALTGEGDQTQTLSLFDWLGLLRNTIHTLIQLIHRVKAVHDVMRHAVDISADKKPGSMANAENSSTEIHVSVKTVSGDKFLSEEEHQRVCAKLRDLLTSVCDLAHERVAQLVSAQDRTAGSQGTPLLMEKATASEVYDLSKVIDIFTKNCEKICGRMSTALHSAFKVQASKFIQRFHQDRKNKLNLLLDSERWKQADVPVEFQDLIDHIMEAGTFSLVKREGEIEATTRKPASFLLVGEEKFAVVGTVLLFLKMVAEYCTCAQDLALMSGNLCRNVAELLQLFNSNCSELFLGAGALHVAGLKTITSTNLALTSRALQLLLWLIPRVKLHFQCLMDNQHASYRASGGGIGALDNVMKNVQSHAKEVDDKVLSIISTLVVGQLAHWEGRPPVPSRTFRNIWRHLTKLHEAVGSILPETQVISIYRNVHQAFKVKLREQLLKMNIVNNGGPQHGVVTAELTFYLEALRALKVLQSEELADESMNEIWDARAANE